MFFHAFRVLHPLFGCYARIVRDRLRVLTDSLKMDEQGGICRVLRLRKLMIVLAGTNCRRRYSEWKAAISISEST